MSFYCENLKKMEMYFDLFAHSSHNLTLKCLSEAEQDENTSQSPELFFLKKDYIEPFSIKM